MRLTPRSTCWRPPRDGVKSAGRGDLQDHLSESERRLSRRRCDRRATSIGGGCHGAPLCALLQMEGSAPWLSPTSTFFCSPFFSLHPLWREPHRPPKELRPCRVSSRRRARNCRASNGSPTRPAAISSYLRIAAGRPVAPSGSWSRNILHAHRRSGPIPLSIWPAGRATSPPWRSTGSSLPISSATGTSWW